MKITLSTWAIGTRLGTMGLAGVRLVGAGFPKDFERLDPQTVKIELSTIEQVHWAFYGTSHPLLENGRAWVKAGWKRLKGLDV